MEPTNDCNSATVISAITYINSARNEELNLASSGLGTLIYCILYKVLLMHFERCIFQTLHVSSRGISQCNGKCDRSLRHITVPPSHISSSIPVTLDPLQFAYRPNRSTDDAISHILHSSLTHIDSSNRNYARLLFIDYSSAFNTIVPIKLTSKLTDLGLNTSLCDWIQDFLTGRPQVVKVG